MLQPSANYLFIWAIALIVGLALSVIILGEVIYRLQHRRRPLAATLQVVRNLVLPMLAFMLFIQYVLQRPANDEIVKSVQTLFWICVLHAALSLLNAVIFEQAKADTWRARVPKLLIDLFRLFLVLLGTAIVLATVWNADLAGLVTALGVSSIVIGLALQDTLGSVMSGIALLFERPFSVGDWLTVGEVTGQVIDINWRAVRLQTFEREMVIIPHKLIGNEIIRNFSRPIAIHAERIRHGFSYNDPPNLAKHVLLTTALETEGILKDPEPEIFTISYDDFAITYEVKFYISDYCDIESIRDRFMSRIWYAAQRNNLTIPFPIRTLYHFNGPTLQAQGTSKKFTESLQSIPAFVPLQNPDAVADGIDLQHYGAGEKVIWQGVSNNSLYIVIAGQAIMTVSDRDHLEHELLTIKTGEFFGEMTLFSGEPSPISITAIADLEVMMLSASAVNQMIDRQPSFAREISQILETRRRLVNTIQKA
ncbi:small-conductance mechanosensitive channel [Pseudanabaena sp. SR411]|uniref:mechanosensitive ion channel family protein n=1 Tax=Pseudanabaena sp. SR411 TaxID=1980935 RepID=UPI000B9815A6|nr:mechanosensitive ion channel family protein [Pseudanabaena sp. SR411]OYQ63345.1 small-conductance mechanosensitive channel [Pseudanabaena sp. SR411]